MKRSVVTAAVIAVAAAAWIVSGQIGNSGEHDAARRAGNAERAESLPQVRVRESVAREFHARTVLTGQTAAVRRVELKAETEGPIEKVIAAEGASLDERDPIARIAIKDRNAQLAQARATVAQRRAQYEAAQSLAGRDYYPKTKLAADKAELDRALAQLKQIEIDIADTTIRAPFAGVLERRFVEVGDFVKRGDRVAMIVDLDPILVVAQVSETDVGALAAGKPGRARIAPGREVEGTIRYVAATADQATRTFRVELEVANPDGEIREGMTAELVLPGRTLAAHLISPALLSLADDGRIGVKLVRDGVVRFLPVRILGDATDGVWLAGLPERASVIVVGHEYVSEGQRVEAVPAAATETTS